MKNYIVYSELTGEILKVGQCHDDDIGLQPDYNMSQNVIETDVSYQNDSTHYVDITSTPTVMAKVLLQDVITDWSTLEISANGLSVAILGDGDLPFGTTIYITPPTVDDTTMTQLLIPDPIVVTDGQFNFRHTFPGSYTITAKIFPYFDYTNIIVAKSTHD